MLDTTVQTRMSLGKETNSLIVHNINVNIRYVECECTDWVQKKYNSNRTEHS